MQLDDNVTKIAPAPSPFPEGSKLYFPVVQKRLFYRHDNTRKPVATHKLLARKTDDSVTPLSIVGIAYKVIRNDELFPHVEQRMRERLDPHLLRGVQVSEQMSYHGRDCYREYVFPNLRCNVQGSGDVAFRLIIGNSYGAKSVSLIAGAIDFFCTNGMIIGTHERTARKHTSGLTVQGLDAWIGDSVTYFTQHTERMQSWAGIPISHTQVDGLFEHLSSRNLLSTRHAAAMAEAMDAERLRRRRSPADPAHMTMWHLYSALTAWASHGIVRDTGNDHVANTRIERGHHVNRIMSAAQTYVQVEAA